ncbi:hypothetical protein TWF696_000383 [Orbilia brochopaga]|uniref:Uncharacterized protein n=1 Tax=Orbilia brochopaga TaxID=3140254 RepID=A0AAV9VDW4_9PEZI
MKSGVIKLAVMALHLGASASPLSGGFVPSVGPFGLSITTADPTMNNLFLSPYYETNSSQVLLAMTDRLDRSFYWVPNSPNPVPPGPYLAQGTLLYEVKFHTAAYNLTVDLAQWNSTQDLFTPVILRTEYETGTPYAHSAAYSRPGVIFLNDTAEFLGCRGTETYTLNWQTNFEPGRQGQIDYHCAPVIVSISNN